MGCEATDPRRDDNIGFRRAAGAPREVDDGAGGGALEETLLKRGGLREAVDTMDAFETEWMEGVGSLAPFAGCCLPLTLV